MVSRDLYDPAIRAAHAMHRPRPFAVPLGVMAVLVRWLSRNVIPHHLRRYG